MFKNMNTLKLLLVISTIAIYALTVIVSVKQGINWPAVAIGDLSELNWRSQFNFDFIVHLLLLATWVTWREGGSAKAYLFGFLSIVMGGMFSFPYIIYAIFKAKGEPKTLLMGVHAKS